MFDYGLAVRLPAVVCPDPNELFTSFDDIGTGGLVRVDNGEATLLLDGT